MNKDGKELKLESSGYQQFSHGPVFGDFKKRTVFIFRRCSGKNNGVIFLCVRKYMQD